MKVRKTADLPDGRPAAEHGEGGSARQLLVGVAAGVVIPEEGEIHDGADGDEPIGKNNDGDVAGLDLGGQAADLHDDDEQRRDVA